MPSLTAELLAGLGSKVPEDTLATSDRSSNVGRLLAAKATTRKVSLWPAAMVPSVNAGTLLTVAFTHGSGPPVWVAETRVSPGGRESVRSTFWASEGPALNTVKV